MLYLQIVLDVLVWVCSSPFNKLMNYFNQFVILKQDKLQLLVVVLLFLTVDEISSIVSC